MTTPNIPNWQENKPDSPNTFAWAIGATFTALVLCLLIIYCGLVVWFVRNRGLDNFTQTPVPTSGTPVDILQEVSSDPAWKLLVEDKFDDNKNKWAVGPYENDSLTVTRSIQDGKYVWDYQSSQGWYFSSYPSFPTVKDFVASVEITHTAGYQGEGYGLVFREEGDRSYIFQIAETGSAGFYLHTSDGNYTPIMDRSTSAIKVGEPNRLTVQVTGSHFVFYVNDQLVGDIDDDRIPSGYVGVFTTTSGLPESASSFNPPEDGKSYPSKFEIDNFKVWVPVSGVTKLETLTPEGGRIAFVSNVDGNPEIYSINIDDAVVKRLTNNKADDTSPKWSPDGSKIAFVSMRDGNSEIYMMSSDGSDVTRITTDDSSDVDPAWSPDGKKIVFSSNRDGDYEIFVHTLDTNAEEQLTQNYSEDRNPNWSSKSDTILYKSIQYGSPGFYELNISTGKDARVPVQIVPLNISRLTLSHDSLKFLYEGGISASSSSIVMHNISDKRSIELVGKIGSNFSPVWSPTDKQIAYASNSDGQTDIYIINDEGTSIFRLTNNTAKEWDIDWTGN